MPVKYLTELLQDGAFWCLSTQTKFSKIKIAELQRELNFPLLVVDLSGKTDLFFDLKGVDIPVLWDSSMGVELLSKSLQFVNQNLAVWAHTKVLSSLSKIEQRNFWLNLKKLKDKFPYIVFIVEHNSSNYHFVMPECIVEIGDVKTNHSKGVIAWEQDAKSLVQDFEETHKLHLLKLNPPRKSLSFFINKWWLIALFMTLLALIIPTPLSKVMFLYKDLQNEYNQYSREVFVQHEFDGATTMQRVAKHAIGRFTTAVPSVAEVTDYLKETLRKNTHIDSVMGRKWNKTRAIYPDSGLTIRFYPPEKIYGDDEISSAWRYYTSLLSDSLAYVTEYHNLNPNLGRIHRGVDVAGRTGTRIFSPFNGKAWTFEDDRGGVVIAIAQDSLIVLYMHCDQLLYIDGQRAYKGDPVATVGMTGHTTGPHVHIATGVLNPKGKYSAGPHRYNMMDPVLWFQEYLSK
ncbi:MAG: M23 family metallopeptidase [Fibrobacter sp.]|nr:M23 family metallopeptidase [Fibrobacter sp.]